MAGTRTQDRDARGALASGSPPRPHAAHSPDDLARRAQELGPRPERCLVCPAPAPTQLFFRDEKWFWLCGSCGLVWVHDIYPEFVTDTAYLDHPERYEKPRAKAREVAEWRELLAIFEARRNKNRLLEVGCSVGLFLETAKRAGWNASGVEILPEVARAAREDRGLDVREGDLLEANFPEGEFDVLYANEVFEHVVDPIELLREARRVVRPGGIVVIRTGNARSWSARFRGSRWPYYHFGGHDHIRYWSPGAGAALAEASGFRFLDARTHGFAFREAGEMRGRWFKPAVALAQACVSPLASPFGAGHRMALIFERP